MRVLLVSTYELGHQPLHLASPAAALRDAGHHVETLDLSVEPWDHERVARAGAIAFSVPMHTAMRLAIEAATRVRATRPAVPICLYGLYAPVARERTLGRVADRVIAGEYETTLVAWVDDLAAGRPGRDGPEVVLAATPFRRPDRSGLPALDRYARLVVAGEERLAGIVEASHGCAHRCRHCPVPVVYDGRIRVVDVDSVLDDVAQQVAAGARHITFGDPDFLNGPHHSRRVVRGFAERFPGVTFDCTVKVKHILRHAEVWDEWATAGCLFVVSAFESVDDAILGRLHKGHTTADAAEAVRTLRTFGIEIRPSFLPFTPWTAIDHLARLVDFVEAHELVENVDPVQYTIRLLLPDGSLLLGDPDLAPYLGPYDPQALTYRWTAADPGVDCLQKEIASLVEDALEAGQDTAGAFAAVRECAYAAAGRPTPAPVTNPQRPVPRLSEPWFCCAEPTERQLDVTRNDLQLGVPSD